MSDKNDKNKDRVFVSASGTATDVLQKLAKAVYERGGNDNDLRRIISDASLRDRLADLIVGERPKSEPISYVVTVDLTKTLGEMVAAGKYDWENSDIDEKNFPTPQTASVTEISLELVHFNKVMTTKEIESELDRRGFRPATLVELLALGAKYPELQRQFPLVALASSWVDPDGDRNVPCLGRSGGERYLYLHWGGPEIRWRVDYRFVAVRK